MSTGDLIKMQILIQQLRVGPEHWQFWQTFRWCSCCCSEDHSLSSKGLCYMTTLLFPFLSGWDVFPQWSLGKVGQTLLCYSSFSFNNNSPKFSIVVCCYRNPEKEINRNPGSWAWKKILHGIVPLMSLFPPPPPPWIAPFIPATPKNYNSPSCFYRLSPLTTCTPHPLLTRWSPYSSG